MEKWTYLNTEFVNEAKACINFHDLALQRGYGVFDFFKVVNFTPHFLEEHLNRFFYSAEQMRLPVKKTAAQLKVIIFELIHKNNIPDSGIRITLSGGEAADSFQITSPNLIISQHIYLPPTEAQLENGIKLISFPHQRQLPHIKTIDYLMAIWLQPYIKQQGADDVVYHQNGLISECPRSNFFIVLHNETIVTPSEHILKGITRKHVLAKAATLFHTEERAINLEEVLIAKEVFITSTTKAVLSVAVIDGKLIGNGSAGLITKKIKSIL